MSKIATSVYRFGPVTYDLSARTHIMGILNVTPDSFSDGGQYLDHELAVRRGMAMVDEGADIIDIGGESTRPGSEAISGEEELRRVLPVIERLAKSTSIPVSIDTVKPLVAQRALEAGAVIVNDISGLHGDPAMAAVIAGHNASIVIMHMKGTPKSMQVDPSYEDVVEEISQYLREGILTAEQHGIEQIVVDPGIGFGKTLSHNLEIIRRLREFERLDYPVMVGPSRKSFIGKVLGLEVDERLEGTAAAVAASVMNGANLVRVHDVREMKRVAQMTDAIMRG
ncbi:MAG TPA: dihydropteroate synthase [Bacteroidota bacterium]|nr:dihydropteroate synthase [Bacteroidota bacterium]